jgi:CelD/BcsL family acetyltransferase involved in cellulose biosynthesis
MLLGRFLSHSLYRDELSFGRLEAEWNDLFRRSGIQTPFLRYSWMRLCWERHREVRGSRLLIIVVREDDRPVLIACFVTRPRLLILQSASFLDSLTPQYNDVLVEQSPHASEYVDYLWRALHSMRRLSRFDAMWVRIDSPFARPLLEVQGASKPTSHKAAIIDLTKFHDWNSYANRLSQKLRRDHGRQMRNLDKRGVVGFELTSNAPCDSKMAWIFDHKRQWLDRTDAQQTWLKEVGTEELYTAAAKEGLESGRAWLSTLSLNGGTIAAMLGFREGSTLYMSKIAYDRCWHTYSPARTLMLLTIERAFKDGIQRCDLMTGRGPWKDALATDFVKVVSRTVWFRGRITKSKRKKGYE